MTKHSRNPSGFGAASLFPPVLWYALPAGILMIELVLSKIKIDENRSEQVIVLQEREGSRMLPVVIGIAEVNAIKLKLSGIEPPRPLTHDLLLNSIQHLGARLKEIHIDKLEDNTFHAKL